MENTNPNLAKRKVSWGSLIAAVLGRVIYVNFGKEAVIMISLIVTIIVLAFYAYWKWTA